MDNPSTGLDPKLIPDPTSQPVPQPPAESGAKPYSYPFAVRRSDWWRGLVAIVGVVFIMALGQGFGVIAYLIGQLNPALEGGLTIGPISFLGLNLSLILLIPGSLLLSKWLYGSAAELLSVLGRLRWGLMARAALIVVPVWTLIVGSGLILGVKPPSPVTWALIIIAILTTPLQAAGEEMAFRGLLFRATATWAPRHAPRWVGFGIGLVVSSALFSAAHLVLDPWMASYYFIFGVSLCLIAWRVGGLEVSILIHAWHNTLSMVVGLLTVGSIDALATRGDANPGPAMILYDVIFLAAAGITWLITRRKGAPTAVMRGA